MILSDLQPEQVLFTHYRLTELLEQDNYTAFWRGVDEKSRRQVLIHFLPTFIKADLRAVQELRRVGWMVVELRHSNIGRCHELLEDVDYTAIASEFMEGNSINEIREAAEHARFEVDEVRELLRQTLSGLHYAHLEKQIVHAGLTPSDIRVNDRGGVKIFGFQTSAVLFDALVRKGFEEWDATAVPYYSPQRWNGEPATELDDVYSLGVIIYELLTGHQPFIDHGVVQLSGDIPTMISMRERDGDAGQPIPEEWEIAIAACTQTDPEARPHSIEELAFRLGLAITGDAALSKPEIEQITPRREISADHFALDEKSDETDNTYAPSLPLNIIGALVGVIAVCFLAFWYIERQNDEIKDSNAAAAETEQAERARFLESLQVNDLDRFEEDVSTNQLAHLVGTFTNLPVGTVTHKIIQTPAGGLLLLGRFGISEQAPLQFVRVTSAGSILADSNSVQSIAGTVHDALLQPDGKLIIAGSFSRAGEPAQPLARFNRDGSLDLAFQSDIDGSLNSMVLQSDGRLVIGGAFTNVNDTAISNIARLSSDGSLDTTFGLKAGSDGQINDVVQLVDGRLVVAGSFTTLDTIKRNSMARLTPDGQVDLTFAVGAGPNRSVETVEELNDGALLVGGEFTRFNDFQCGRMVKLQPNGRVDPSFRIGTGANRVIRSIAVTQQGGIMIGGDFDRIGTHKAGYFAVLSPTGEFNEAASIGGGFSGPVADILLDDVGNTLIAGNFSNVHEIPRHGVAEFAFNQGQVPETAPLEFRSSDPAGPILSADSTFNIGLGVAGTVQTIAVRQDGGIIVGGQFSRVNTTARSSLTLLTPEGTVDAIYGEQATLDGAVDQILIQLDNKALVAGEFTLTASSTIANLMRLNDDGTLDRSFSEGLEIDGPVRAAALEIDGTVVIGGEFTSIKGVTRRGIAKLSSSGQLISDFDPQIGVNKPIHAVQVMADGSVLIGGEFQRFNGLTRRFVARLKSNGAVDPDFRPDSRITFPVHAMAVQPNGQILIGGGSETASLTDNLARLNADGSLDLRFDFTGGANRGIREIAILKNRKVMIGGFFEMFDRANRLSFAVTEPGGRVDPSIDSASMFSGGVHALAIQPNGKILVGGSFSIDQGAAGNGLIRIDAFPLR